MALNGKALNPRDLEFYFKGVATADNVDESRNQTIFDRYQISL